jgi:hypothetical protein
MWTFHMKYSDINPVIINLHDDSSQKNRAKVRRAMMIIGAMVLMLNCNWI